MKAPTIYWGRPQTNGISRRESPCCNTGGYDFSASKDDATEQKRSLSSSLTTIDWLRATTNNYQSYRGAIGDIEGIMAEADMQINWKDKGLHGYEKSAAITLWKDNTYITVGSIAYSENGNNTGGLFELTGAGCKALSLEKPDLWLELYQVLVYAEWRISRVDVALDLPGDYALAHGYTVPKLMLMTKLSELFKSDSSRNPNLKIGYTQAGDWTDLGILYTHDSYNPLVHCPGGLTLYVGSRGKSDDFFRLYEKGKELLGKMAEPEEIDRAWVRIEHEMTRAGSGRTIPLDVMIRPDSYWCTGRSKARAILNKLRADRELEAAASWQKEQFKREKRLLLSRKIHWAKHTYGRLVHTLKEQGLDDGDIIDLLSREAGLKEFVFDLLDEVPTAQTIMERKKAA